MQDEQWPGVFEPDAESMPADALAALQADRLRSLIDRLIAVGGVQGRPAPGGWGWLRPGRHAGGPAAAADDLQVRSVG